VPDSLIECQECAENITLEDLPNHLEEIHGTPRSDQKYAIDEWYRMVGVEFNIDDVQEDGRFTASEFLEVLNKNTRFLRKIDRTKKKLITKNFIDEQFKSIDFEFPKGCIFSTNVHEKDGYRYLTMVIRPMLTREYQFNDQVLEDIKDKDIELRSINIEFKEIVSPEDYDPNESDLKIDLFSTKILKTRNESQLAKLRRKALELLKGYGIDWKCIDQKDNWIIIQETPESKKVRINLTNDSKEEGVYTFEQTIGILERISNSMFSQRTLDDGAFLEGTLTDCSWKVAHPTHHRVHALRKAIAVWGSKHIFHALMACLKLPWGADNREALEEDLDFTVKFDELVSRYESKFDTVFTMLVKDA